MIRLIECKNYRSLKYISQPIDNFQILVGPNASGKTTFLDVVSFMADIVSKGIDEAITERSSNFQDLTFSGRGGSIEMAVEADLPQEVIKILPDSDLRTIRYEIEIGINPETQNHEIIEEQAVLLKGSALKAIPEKEVPSLFPSLPSTKSQRIKDKYKGDLIRRILRKKRTTNDNFYPETTARAGKGSQGGWIPSFKLGGKRSALGNFPADITKFPAAAWFRDFLTNDIQKFVLDSLEIRKPSPPGKGKIFRTDGSNLPWVIEDLRKYPENFQAWISHLQTALPDIRNIDTIERPEDRHRYLRVHYENNIIVPSWLVSDGTLRLLALTLPAYLPDFKGMYLIEEPENGIHPKAIETVLQSLSSVYDAQMILASHSPVILSQIKPADVLCFAKTDEGITDIVSGDKHPMLRGWQQGTDLGTLYAAGVLG